MFETLFLYLVTAGDAFRCSLSVSTGVSAGIHGRICPFMYFLGVARPGSGVRRKSYSCPGGGTRAVNDLLLWTNILCLICSCFKIEGNPIGSLFVLVWDIPWLPTLVSIFNILAICIQCLFSRITHLFVKCPSLATLSTLFHKSYHKESKKNMYPKEVHY